MYFTPSQSCRRYTISAGGSRDDPHGMQGDEDDLWKSGNLNADKLKKIAEGNEKLSVKLRMQVR